MALDILKFIKGILIKNDGDTSKQVELNVSNTATTATKTTIVAAQTANRTITLPDQTGTLATDNDLALKADQDLSNLTLTSINESLVPDSDSTKSVGDPDFMWANGYFNSLRDTNDNLSISVSGRTLNTTTEDATVDYENKQLKTAGTIKLDWSATDVSLNTRKLTNVTDPSLAQDAATKNYVDTQDANKVTGPASSVDGEIALFDATTGKLIKRATGTGPVKATSGVYSTGNINLASEVTGTLPIANGGTGQTSQTAAFDALAPTTTKGDIIVHDGTDNIRVVVGSNNQVLTADSATASGVKWASVNSQLTVSTYTATGAIAAGDDVALLDATSGSMIIALPTAVGITGKKYTIKRIDNSVNSITLDANGTQTIDGQLSFVINTQNDYITVVSDGANWKILDLGISVSARYKTSAGQSIQVTVGDIVNFGTKDWDSHNAVTTGISWKFTAPFSGEYSINVMNRWDGSFTANNVVYQRIYKNGTGGDLISLITIPITGSTNNLTMQGSVRVKLQANDYIQFYAVHQEGTAKTLFANGISNWIEINRIGSY